MSKKKKIQYVFANFGGPRHLDEIEIFLKSLLRDRDVIRTNMPKIIHHFLFGRIAKRRSVKIRPDYEKIGGKSPIYEDTEAIAQMVGEKLGEEIWTFHRYIPSTHKDFFRKMKRVNTDEIRVFPFFPQFSYATTGSIARCFAKNLHPHVVEKIRWISSYPTHPGFINSYIKKIQTFLQNHQLLEKDCVLLFSAHGVPKRFVDEGDRYQKECEESFHLISKAFPSALSRLCYQSKFGPGEWLKPYTEEASKDILDWKEGKTKVLFVPLSFTSDHIETLFEIEELYLPLIQKKNLHAYRIEALNREPYWLEGIGNILKETTTPNNVLIRK